MASFLLDLVKPYVEKLINGAIAEARLVFCFTCIAKEFDEERARLEAERITLGQRTKVAIGKDKDIQANVGFWEEEVDKLLREDTKTKQTCFYGSCPNCIWRYKRGKELADDLEEIKRLIEKGEKLENIDLPRRLPDVERYSSQNYISFKSRESKYNELLNALKDDNNYMTGLQGMGGTGKTTLAKEVGKELKQSEQFAHVIDTTLSFTPDIKKIQDDIAGPLGLQWEDCNESDRPKKLWSRLTNGEKILLILDDVWDRGPTLDFDAIGIPKRDNHKGCRFLVTTRSKQTFNKMDCDKNIELELLSEEDAWIMFKRYVGICNNSSKSLISKARKISKECKQLPVAIAVIASSLKGQQHRGHEWDVTLKSLKKPVSMHDVDGDMVGIYKCLKFSYDYMKDEKAKGLFLLCSIFREDEEISIEVLTRLCTGGDIFREDYSSYDDVRNQVVVAKNKLLDSCLLLEVAEKCVKMHDLVRDVAQWIANKEIRGVNLSDKNQKSLVEKEASIKHLLCEGKVIDLFSWKFDGSKLETLIVNADRDDDYESMEFSNSFFENIIKLRVLYFSSNYKRRLSLPQSIQSLTNIRSMLVDRVDLGDISVLGNLQSLESLDLVECTINELPSEITKLEKFKLLNLERCEIRRNNPFEVIERCASLEELYFKESFNDFCREITLPELQRYCICKFWRPMDDSLSKCVAFHVNDENFFSKGALKYFMQTAKALRLSGIIGGSRNLMPEIVPIDLGMNDLVDLSLMSIPQLQCLIDTIGSQAPNVLSELVVLKLILMDNLEELFSGPISFDSLKNLEKLSIENCKHLRSLFKCNLNLCNLKTMVLQDCPLLVSLFLPLTSRSLVLLEKLKISNCEGLEDIIVDERREEESTEEIDGGDKKIHGSIFSKLKVLEIERCPRLESILSVLPDQDLPLLENIIIRRCDSLKYIFGQYRHGELGSLRILLLNDLPNLIDIFRECTHPMSSCVKRSSSTSNNGSKAQTKLDPFKCNIFSWTQICCHGDKYTNKPVSATTTTIPLVDGDQLQDCSVASESNSHSFNKCQYSRCLSIQSKMLHNIKEIELFHVPKIKSIFISSMLLESLIVMNCDELKHITIDTGDGFPKLKRLDVKDCTRLEYIFRHYSDCHQNCTEIHLHLPALECLKLSNLPSLIAMCPKNYHTALSSLKKLVLNECPQVAIKSIEDFITHRSITRSVDTTIMKELSANMEHILALEKLVIKNIKVESIFCLKEVNEQKMTLRLLCIELHDLPVMTCLFAGPKSSFSLQSLDVLKIVGCEKLEIVFSTSIVRCLPQLRHLIIKECNELKHIIEDDVDDKKGSNYLSSRTSFPILELLTVINCNKLKCVFPISESKELPRLKVMLIREADELEEIFKSECDDQKVEIPYLNFIAFLNLPSLRQTQEIQFQAVENCFIQNCQKLSLITTSTAKNIMDIYYLYFGKELKLHEDFVNLFKQLQPEYKGGSYCNEYQISEDFPTEIDVEAASGHGFASSQDLMNQLQSLGLISTKELHTNFPYIDVMDYPIDILDQGYINDDSFMKVSTDIGDQFAMDDEVKVSKSNPLIIASQFPSMPSIGFSDGTEVQATCGHALTYLPENGMESKMKQRSEANREFIVNVPDDLEIPSVTNSPTSSEGSEFGFKDLVSLANLKRITPPTHSEPNISSSGPLVTYEPKTSSHEYGDGQIDIPSFVISKREPLTIEDVDLGDSQERTQTNNDQASVNDDAFVKVNSNIEEQSPKDDEIIVSKSKPSPSITSPAASQCPSMLSKDSDLYLHMESVYRQFQAESKGRDNGNEYPNAQTTIEFAAWIEVQAALGHKLTSSQKLMNEQPKDQQCLMNSQHSLGQIDTTIKPSPGNKLVGSNTSAKIVAATLSTISETRNEAAIQFVVPKQKGIEISVEEGTTSTNAKTITSSTHFEILSSSSGSFITSECKTSSHEDGDGQLAMASLSIATIETNNEVSRNDDAFKKVSSNIGEQFSKDDKIIVSNSKPSTSITSSIASQFPSVSFKGDPSQIDEHLSSTVVVTRELEQLVSKKHLARENLSLLTDFLVKHPSVRLKDNSLRNRYKGCAYNLLAELLKFLETHSVLDVLGSCHSEFVELLLDARNFAFDKGWLDAIERRTLFPDIQVSQDALQKLLDSKKQVTKDVEGLRFKIDILSQHVEDLRHQLTSSEAVLESIIQQEAALSAPIGY